MLAGVLDLCDRNGWLLGAANECTQRELVQRSLRGPAGAALWERLVAGNDQALERTMADGTGDAELDLRAFHKNLPAADMAAA